MRVYVLNRLIVRHMAFSQRARLQQGRHWLSTKLSSSTLNRYILVALVILWAKRGHSSGQLRSKMASAEPTMPKHDRRQKSRICFFIL